MITDCPHNNSAERKGGRGGKRQGCECDPGL